MILPHLSARCLHWNSSEMKKCRHWYQQYLVAGPAGYVKDLFVGMGMKDADNKADMFYSVMFFYYSLYDGAEEKGQIKDRFENVIDDIALKLNN